MKIDFATQKNDTLSYEQQNIEATMPGNQTEPKPKSKFNEIKNDETNKDLVKTDDVKQAVDKLNQTARIFNKRFHFSIDEGTNRVIVQVIDTISDKIINEIPPKKVLDIIASVNNLLGLMVDEKL